MACVAPSARVDDKKFGVRDYLVEPLFLAIGAAISVLRHSHWRCVLVDSISKDNNQMAREFHQELFAEIYCHLLRYRSGNTWLGLDTATIASRRRVPVPPSGWDHFSGAVLVRVPPAIGLARDRPGLC